MRQELERIMKLVIAGNDIEGCYEEKVFRRRITTSSTKTTTTSTTTTTTTSTTTITTTTCSGSSNRTQAFCRLCQCVYCVLCCNGVSQRLEYNMHEKGLDGVMCVRTAVRGGGGVVLCCVIHRRIFVWSWCVHQSV